MLRAGKVCHVATKQETLGNKTFRKSRIGINDKIARTLFSNTKRNKLEYCESIHLSYQQAQSIFTKI